MGERDMELNTNSLMCTKYLARWEQDEILKIVVKLLEETKLDNLFLWNPRQEKFGINETIVIKKKIRSWLPRADP
jgi:hypothetical protein